MWGCSEHQQHQPGYKMVLCHQDSQTDQSQIQNTEHCPGRLIHCLDHRRHWRRLGNLYIYIYIYIIYQQYCNVYLLYQIQSIPNVCKQLLRQHYSTCCHTLCPIAGCDKSPHVPHRDCFLPQDESLHWNKLCTCMVSNMLCQTFMAYFPLTSTSHTGIFNMNTVCSVGVIATV